ncbi:unnamed protein product [Diamesa serratosioi]
MASNGLVEWFGRSIKTNVKIADFFLNTNIKYEHNIMAIKQCEPFEERPSHFNTKESPAENYKESLDETVNEEWFECELSSPIACKEALKTPPHKSSSSYCPPPPTRGRTFLPLSDDELEPDEDDIEGIEVIKDTPKKATNVDPESPECKRICLVEETTSGRINKYSDLKHLEATATVHITRSKAQEGSEERECIIQMSYRQHIDDPKDIQIALIVYKQNSDNPPHSRRNLMSEFDEKATESPFSSPVKQARTGTKLPRPSSTKKEISSAPPAPNHQTKATKRPNCSKNSLRF